MSKPAHFSDAVAPTLTGPAGELDPRLAARLFLRLSEQFGDRIADMYASSSAQAVHAQWSAVLAGFAPEEIARGLNACRSRAYPPDVSQFARLCRPGMEPEWAWCEAVEGLRERAAGRMGEWTHPAVWRAACEMSHELAGQPFGNCRKRWEWLLNREFARGWGEPIPAPHLRLTSAVKVGPPPSATRERIAAILASARRSPRLSTSAQPS